MKTDMNWPERRDTSQIVTRSQTFPFDRFFDRIPLYMKEEILMKLKAKHISKFITVSKSWSSIVRRKDFTNLYLTRSMTQPRILFCMGRQDISKQLFYSCSQEDPPSDVYRVNCSPPNPNNWYDFSDVYRVNCSPPNPNNWYDFSPPVRGLISCLDKRNKVMIGNPSTGQFITLPRVKTLRKDIISFFGYDPITDVYKVLCMTVSRRKREPVSEEHQVFTLGAKKKKWEKIECEILHYVYPRTQGIYNNGVVYYLSLINQVTSLICFDVGSEKFSVVSLPIDVLILANSGRKINLSNHGKKIAVTKTLIDGKLDLYVLEDARKQVWSKQPFSVPHWSKLFGPYEKFKLRGILGTNELLFAPCIRTSRYCLVCCNLKEKNLRKITIKKFGYPYSLEVFLDHVESPMFLQL